MDLGGLRKCGTLAEVAFSAEEAAKGVNNN